LQGAGGIPRLAKPRRLLQVGAVAQRLWGGIEIFQALSVIPALPLYLAARGVAIPTIRPIKTIQDEAD